MRHHQENHPYMKLDPRGIYLSFELKWGLESYIHKIGLNANYPNYVTSALYHKGFKMSNPEFLYKFYAPENHNFESLEDPYLYFGDPSDFNDTFDCVMSQDSYIETFLEKKYLDISNKIEKADAIITISVNFSGLLPEWEEIAATAMAVQNMYLTASVNSVGCYWSTPGMIRHLDEFLGLEENQKCYGLFYLGNI